MTARMAWIIEVGSDYRIVLSVPFTGDGEFSARGRYEYARHNGRTPDYIVLVERKNGCVDMTAYGTKSGSESRLVNEVFDGEKLNPRKVLSYF